MSRFLCSQFNSGIRELCMASRNYPSRLTERGLSFTINGSED